MTLSMPVEIPVDAPLKNLHADRPGDRGAKRRCRNRENPGPDDIAGHAPTHRRHLARSANADNGAGNGMCRRNRYAHRCREEQRGRAAGFSAETADRLELGDFLSHGSDDAPSAKQGSQADRAIATDGDPYRWIVDTGITSCDQQHPDDAYGLLRIVAAMAEAIHGS